MVLVSLPEMKELEEKANEKGLTYDQMMKAAGSGIAHIVDRLYDHLRGVYPIIGLAGSGNNGGDTIIALEILASLGWDVQALVYHRSKDSDPYLFELSQSNIQIRECREKILDEVMLTDCILLDGLLGTGTTLPLKPELKKILAHMKSIIQNRPFQFITVAVDNPSGIDCDTGEVPEETIPANVTICLAAIKQGLVTGNALGYCGEIIVSPIGFDQVIPGWQKGLPEVLSDRLVHQMLPMRDRLGHKGTFGTGLVVGGSSNFIGAPLLAGKAAASSGAGMIQMGVPSTIHPILAGAFPEAIWLLLPEEGGRLSVGGVDILKKTYETISGMLIGPGMGLEPATEKFVRNILFADNKKSDHIGFNTGGTTKNEETYTLPPLVIDADGLKLMAKTAGWHKLLPPGTILTPHPGEMSILTGLSVEEIQSNRREVAIKYAKEWKCVVVLKGAGTIIAEPKGQSYLMPFASSSLAHAGTGDVLAGIILGLRVQGLPAFEAASAGVWIHGKAALLASEVCGHPASVLAGDLIDQIGSVLQMVWQQ